MPVRAAAIELLPRTIEQKGVTVEFPAVTYRGAHGDGGDPVTICAGVASAALGTRVSHVYRPRDARSEVCAARDGPDAAVIEGSGARAGGVS